MAMEAKTGTRGHVGMKICEHAESRIEVGVQDNWLLEAWPPPWLCNLQGGHPKWRFAYITKCRSVAREVWTMVDDVSSACGFNCLSFACEVRLRNSIRRLEVQEDVRYACYDIKMKHARWECSNLDWRVFLCSNLVVKVMAMYIVCGRGYLHGGSHGLFML
ncbi:hypothetical protein L7F22_004225 [Adiantum nelumboides]|nr:hypothetical protein [Adiantum nelumboides]